jgi:hypothetical protein
MAPDTAHTVGTDDSNGTNAATATESPEDRAERMAKAVCEGFVAHDDREWEAAVEAFATVDRGQFAHLSEAEVYAAAEAYVAALWEKDRVEDEHIDGEHGVDAEALDDADWSGVEDCLRERADIVGMDATYATATVEAWRNHKTGGDYWTPTMVAQRVEVDAALGEAAPDKEKFGRSGFGHLPAFYLAGTELHDMHTRRHWKQAAQLMTMYFQEILLSREGVEDEAMLGVDGERRAGGDGE